MGNVFTVNFETGSLAQFSATDIGTNTSAVNATAKKTGNYGWQMIHAGGDMIDAWGYMTMSSETELWFGFHHQLKAMNLPAYGSAVAFSVINSGYTNLLAVRLEDSTGNGIPDRWRFDGSGLTLVRSSTNFSFDTWHWVEAHYKAGTGADGEVQCWVDNSQLKNETGLNLSGNTFFRTYFGFDQGTPTANDEWYLDNAMADDAGRITEPTDEVSGLARQSVKVRLIGA